MQLCLSNQAPLTGEVQVQTCTQPTIIPYVDPLWLKCLFLQVTHSHQKWPKHLTNFDWKHFWGKNIWSLWNPTLPCSKECYLESNRQQRTNAVFLSMEVSDNISSANYECGWVNHNVFRLIVAASRRIYSFWGLFVICPYILPMLNLWSASYISWFEDVQ